MKYAAQRLSMFLVPVRIINRPGVARAVLQTPPLLIHSVSESSFVKLGRVGPVDNTPFTD